MPRQAEGTEGSLPWANFSPLQQGTIPLLPLLPPPPLPRWEWSEQVLTHPLGGAVHHLLVPHQHQQLLRRFLACWRLQRALKAQGFQQGDGSDSAFWRLGRGIVACTTPSVSPAASREEQDRVSFGQH